MTFQDPPVLTPLLFWQPIAIYLAKDLLFVLHALQASPYQQNKVRQT